MKKLMIITPFLLIVTANSYMSASDNETCALSFKIILNDKVKSRIIKNLGNYQTLNIKDSALCNTYMALHDEISNKGQLAENDIQAAQMILDTALLDQGVQQAYNQSLQDALKIKENKIEVATSKTIETSFAPLKVKICHVLAAYLQSKTGITITKPIVSNEDRKVFAELYKELSQEACHELKQSTLALYQVTPLIEHEVAKILR